MPIIVKKKMLTHKQRGEVKIVQRMFTQFRQWLAVTLALLLLVTGVIPSLPVSAADKPIILEDAYNGKGTSASQAYTYGSSKITIGGTFGGGVSGENLRIKITLGNGTEVPGLDKLTPTISGNKFTFYDISLQPGLNKITFYENIGSVVREHLHFYVNYNNTPILEEINVEDTVLNPSGTTYISVPSSSRMVLNMSGKALNADTVIVENLATNEEIRSSVSKTTGFFGLNLPVMFGENTLRITAMNQNKTVGAIQRKLVVVTTSLDEADLLYNLSINNSRLTPNTDDVKGDNVVRVSDVGTTDLDFAATALLQYDKDNAAKPFESIAFVVKEDGLSSGTEHSITLGSADKKAANDGFFEYDLKTTVTDTFTPGKSYDVWLVYKYKENTDPTTVASTFTVKRYMYTFKAVKENDPQFLSGSYKGAALSTSKTNTLVDVPAELELVGEYVDDPTKYKLELNGQALNPSLYSVSVASYKNPDGSVVPNKYVVKITLMNSDPGTGDLTIAYTDGAGTVLTAVTYPIKWQIAPYVQLTYNKGGSDNSFFDGFQINAESDIPSQLDGRTYNFDLRNDNIEVTLNNQALTIGLDPNNDTFTITKAELTKQVSGTSILKKGTNVLKITLNPNPKPGETPVVFTYNILYITAKAPTIEEVKLWAIYNGKETELTPSASGGSYDTSASFLSRFSFKVQDASTLYVEKNGKRIVEFKNDGSGWKNVNPPSNEYTKTLDEVPDSLDSFFDEAYNIAFKSGSTSASFEGAVSSSEYNRMLDKVQQVAKGTGDQQREEQEKYLALLPLTLKKNNATVYTIVAEDDSGTVVRYNVSINQRTSTWEVLAPVKARPEDPYITVNTNSALIKIFAENADKVMFGKIEAKTTNKTNPDFEFDRDFAKAIPKTYYVFTATVPLKSGLNTVKFTVQVGQNTYNDEIKIFNANSSVDGAEYRDVLGKKVSFSAFDKGIELKFPTGTVLLSPTNNRAGEEVKNPTSDIFVDVPLYFGIADRTTGQVNIPGDSMESRLRLEEKFNYASPLYYIDAGDVENPGGRDPYYDESDGREFRDRYEDNLVPSREGTLTLKYDPSIVNAANNVITVYYHNGLEWQNIGGVVNTGKKTVSVPFRGFGYYMVMKNRESFEDVVNHEFARDAMETLYSKGIMPAYSSSTFGANRDMTRGEFATMLVKALALPIKAGPYHDSNERDPVEPTFVDVRPSRDTWDYQYKYIETAARAGIIRGKEPGYFHPDDPLTREEAAIMIARALNLKLATPEAAALALGKMFTDAKDIGYYATPSVLAVAKAKLMNGEPNDPTAKKPTYSFKPKNNLTRAEMAVITIRVMVQLKKLPKQ